MADLINQKSLISIIMAKECVNKSYEVSLKEGIDFEKSVFWATFATEDRKEGMTAFVEKRDPNFKNE